MERALVVRPLGTALALIACTATLLAAHDTWLLPSSLRVNVGQTIRLTLTSGEAFPVDDFAIAETRVTRADVRLDGRVAALEHPKVGAMSTRYEWTPRTSGVATIVVELAPKTLELTPKLIDAYFEEIHAGAGVRAAWDSVPPPRRWRESYVKHAKTYVRVGAPLRDTSWRIASGLGLEIVPERDPTALRAGDTLFVRAVRHGKPAADFDIGVIREGTPTAGFVKTDRNGRAAIPLPASGRWLLNGTALRRVHEPGLEWRSDFTTMTIAVAPTGAGR